MAQKAATDLGVEGIHEHEYEGKTWYMVGETHELDLYGKCPKGYKKKNGKCVKKWEKNEAKKHKVNQVLKVAKEVAYVKTTHTLQSVVTAHLERKE